MRSIDRDTPIVLSDSQCISAWIEACDVYSPIKESGPRIHPVSVLLLWEVFKVKTRVCSILVALALLLPWLALAAVAAGTTVLVLRRRRAQS